MNKGQASLKELELELEQELCFHPWNLQRDPDRSRKLAALCESMKQQYARLLNHISADPIEQERTELSPKSRHKEDSRAIESAGLLPRLLHHIPHSTNADMFAVASIAAAAGFQRFQSARVGGVVINGSWGATTVARVDVRRLRSSEVPTAKLTGTFCKWE